MSVSGVCNEMTCARASSSSRLTDGNPWNDRAPGAAAVS